jgi:hypothetical protein
MSNMDSEDKFMIWMVGMVLFCVFALPFLSALAAKAMDKWG